MRVSVLLSASEVNNTRMRKQRGEERLNEGPFCDLSYLCHHNDGAADIKKRRKYFNSHPPRDIVKKPFRYLSGHITP
jgi:hypothetical protein